MKLAANPAKWAPQLKQQGYVHVDELLESESAYRLHNFLAEQKTWNLVFTRDGQAVDIGADSVDAWNLEQRHQFNDIVHGPAENGFQYLYKTIPVYDIYHRKLLPGSFFNTLFEFLNSEAFLNFGRELTGRPDIGFCDAQATCFEAGHFLTRHDDATDGKNRVAAFVLNLTCDWNPDWGGALQFYDDQGNIEAGFKPSFNALNVFRIPRKHSVAYVAPFAGGSRYSITGWFRTGEDPKGA
jgi:SM-20-related protein